MFEPVPIDCVILGGGAAGLWTLDAVRRSGRSAVLLEAGEMGDAQTVSAQGIIHGGLKYSLRGLLTASAQAIAAMPDVWRACESGDREPRLRQMRIRAHHCHLWRTQSMTSSVAMLGAGLALRVKPAALDQEDRPEVLRGAPGAVARIDEQVVDPVSMLHELSTRHRGLILRIDLRSGFELRRMIDGRPVISLIEPRSGDLLDLAPDRIILTAGVGNEGLRTQLALDAGLAQRRPLHMTLVRSTRERTLPALNGHCIDGARTRVTITSAEDPAGRVVWQLGGQLAEDGVPLDESALIARAAEELAAVLPGALLDDAEWATYRVDRAERRTGGGWRPDDAQVVIEERVLSVWPTKLALAPRAAELVLAALPSAAQPFDLERVAAWSRPLVALPPWERVARWRRA